MFWPEEGFCAVAEFKETFGTLRSCGEIPLQPSDKSIEIIYAIPR